MSEVERILKFTENRIFSEGFSNVTMDDIASDLKISKKTIYKYFSSKEEFVNAVINQLMEKLKASIVPALNSNKNAIEKLNDLVGILTETTLKINPKMFDDLRQYYPSLWVEVDAFRTKMMFGNITKVIDQGKKEKLFIDYPTILVMNVLVASVRSVVNPDFILNNNFSMSEAARLAFRIIIGGIVTDKGKKYLLKTRRLEYENN
jgi:AcrR family transcriptional regulator